MLRAGQDGGFCFATELPKGFANKGHLDCQVTRAERASAASNGQMAKATEKSCVLCASLTGHGVWQYNKGNLCWKGWLRGLALTDGQGASVAKNGRGVQLLRRTRHTAAAPTHAAPHICWGKMLRGISGLSTGVSSGHGFQGGQPPVLRGCCSPPLGVEGQSGPPLTTAWGSKHSPWGFSPGRVENH